MVASSVPSTVRVDRVALLVGALGTRLTAALGSVLEESLIDTAIIAVLCSLERNESLRPREIQALTAMTSGGTTILLDRLVALDLVARAHDDVAGDRRAVVVSLTPRGRDTVAAIESVFADESAWIRSILAELEGEFGGSTLAPSDGARLEASDAELGGRADSEPNAGGTVLRPVVDAIIGLAQLGFALRRALVAGLHPEVYMDNSVCLVLGSLLAGGPRRPRDLQPLLGMTSGAMTKLLLRIERSGLVVLERHRLEADRRATIVSITPAGRRAMAESSASMAAHATDILAIIGRIDAALTIADHP